MAGQPPLDAQLQGLYLGTNNPFADNSTNVVSSNAYQAPGVQGNPSTSGGGYYPQSSGSSGPAAYPAVPAPAPGPQQTYTGMYAAAPGAYYPGSGAVSSAASGYPSAPPSSFSTASSSGSGAAPGAGFPPQVGPGWTPESVQPAQAAAPGQFGHYGHLQYAPSFNTASAGTAQAAAAAAAGAPLAGKPLTGPGSTAGSAVGGPTTPGNAVGAAAGATALGWVLQSQKLPTQPQQQICGPHVRFNNFDPATGSYALSVLVVSHPSLKDNTVQLHYAVNAPACQSAPGQVLDDFMGYKFWRFDIRLTLADQPGVLNYLVGLVGGQAPMASHSICLPSRREPWRWVLYSCNGFHEDAPQVKYGGIGNLWRDLMQRHSQMRFHLQVGGGDQLYADRLFHLPSLKPWLSLEDHQIRAKEPFTPTMLQEVEQFYFGSYMAHFADPAFAPALASIPFTYSWDDHDIFDGWGSYPDYLQKSAVFQGMFAVARRFYLLFQQHCRYDNAKSISNTMGEYSYHQVHNIGPNVILMSPDTRSERSIHQIVPNDAWDMLLNEVTRRLSAAAPGAVQHLLVLLPVPIVYPKIPVSESLLGVVQGGMRSNKNLKNLLTNMTGDSGAVNVFGEPDILDDLLDHWSAADHTQERQLLVRRLQTIAETYGVRVTFLSGDVHVGAFGCFQAHPKQHLRVVDPKYMLQVISSAIGNEPPPGGVVTALETSSMASTAMGDTLDKMIKAFPGKKKLKAARNYCEVVPLLSPHTCDTTGFTQPPGGLAFTLRSEAGPPGQPIGIETCTQVAPVLLAGPRAAEGSQYAAQHQGHVTMHNTSGVVGQVAALLPGQTGQQLQAGLKTAGHKLANFLARV